MKKAYLFIALLACLWMPFSLHAKNVCGVGATVTQRNNTLLSQSVATTTDGTFQVTNLTAITMGTSGCSNTGFVQSEQQKMYISHTYANLEEEVAKGGGPFLDSLLQLLGCSPQAKADFVQLSQQKYDEIFVEQDNPAHQTEIFFQGVQALMQEPRLVHQCQPVS